ncbi:MAG: His kinase (phospho-acceptor) domain/response regulator receiver domain/histidine kinase [Herbinix sp.]|jgi:signal transduction histidine kinase|nr:His kinase (phospho-acceptor) domain/response regulator receiver domain/histidine kinase [Herbinix sp.]
MKVLVVDDSHLNLAIAKRYLSDIPELNEILLCQDPKHAIEYLNQHDIDILILDILMPEIGGLDILTLLRADIRYDDLPIIMLSSLDDLASYKKCFELGAFDYINKPIQAIELNARLKVAIEWKNNSNHLKSLIEFTKKQNEKLKEMNAELTEAKFSLVQSEKMAAVGQLAAGIAHEINNPMGYVSSNFESLSVYFSRITDFIQYTMKKMEPKVSVENEALRTIAIDINAHYKILKLDHIMNELTDLFTDSISGIKRVTDIVQSLRAFARPSADDEKSTNHLLDLINQVILITKNEVRYLAEIELKVADDIQLYCNRVQICQVFVNIIINAAQAIGLQKNEQLGKIIITAKKIMGKILISFQDNGPGISKENMTKIFEPFFTTKEIGEGTGLGLSISYDIIVNKHHGNIRVDSELGTGTIFTIELPIVTID